MPDHDELRAQVANTIAKHSRRGWRLDKPSLEQPNDSIIALCMALEALENQPEPVEVLGGYDSPSSTAAGARAASTAPPAHAGTTTGRPDGRSGTAGPGARSAATCMNATAPASAAAHDAASKSTTASRSAPAAPTNLATSSCSATPAMRANRRLERRRASQQATFRRRLGGAVSALRLRHHVRPAVQFERGGGDTELGQPRIHTAEHVSAPGLAYDDTDSRAIAACYEISLAVAAERAVEMSALSRVAERDAQRPRRRLAQRDERRKVGNESHSPCSSRSVPTGRRSGSSKLS